MRKALFFIVVLTICGGCGREVGYTIDCDRVNCNALFNGRTK